MSTSAEMTRNLSWERPIVCGRVHKTSVGEVFITDTEAVGPDRLIMAGELPRSHYYFNDTDGFPPRIDVMPLLEVCRQGCYLLASHRQAPDDAKYVLRSIDARIDDDALDARYAKPQRLLIDCEIVRVFERGGVARGMEARVTIETDDGAPLAIAHESFSWMSPAAWEQLRQRNRDDHGLPRRPTDYRPSIDALDAPAIGRECQRNVVIGTVSRQDGAFRAGVAAEVMHPGLFDHYDDHVPGMVQLEACRQLATWGAAETLGTPAHGVAIAEMATGFTAVGELDLDMLATATVLSDDAGAARLAVELSQAGACLCRSEISAVPR